MVKIASHLVVGNRVGQRIQLRAGEISGRSGDHQQAAVVAVGAHLVEEDHLVGEDVGRIAVVVVEVAQLGIQEARRAGRRDHPGRADLGDVLPAAVHLALALLGAERLLGAGRHVVDHRVPDRARVLQHVHVDLAEIGVQDVEIDGPGVVHVEADGLAVVDDQAGVADRAVGGRAQRDDHHVEVALGPADAVLDRVGGLEEPVEAQLLQFAAQVGHREVGQQHDGVLVDVLAQVLRVEVVLVQVGDVEVVARRPARPSPARCCRGTGTRSAKYAGLTHGSHRMLPALVSIRKPACPTLVTCTDVLSSRSVCSRRA